MTDPLPRYAGLWLPLVTPFKDGGVDESSLRRLVRTFAPRVDGLVLCATTGEAPALSPAETQRVVETARDELTAMGADSRILVGLAGASTAGVVRALTAAEHWGGDGFLVTCPYYVRPSQEGLRLHFEAIADAGPTDLVIYNIPYRTGVNLANDTLLRIAERANVVGLKDCCADREQSRDIVRRKPSGFAVLMGDDAGFGAALEDGADGGVTASAHVDPDGFRAVHRLALAGWGPEAARVWAPLAGIPELLFAEPSPGPLKHCLWRAGLIDSPELRLPMTPVSEGLAARLDAAVAAGWPAAAA